MESFLKLDLNLFRVFAAIYQEQSLTRASERLCISQSAVSHALSRMRDQLQDPLFTRESHGVIPTAFAKQIWPSVQRGLDALHEAYKTNESFNPAHDVREVTVAMNDHLESTLLPGLAEAVHNQAPDAKIASVRIERSSLRSDLASGKLDFAIDVAQIDDEHLKSSPLGGDDFVVLSRSAAPLDFDTYISAEHIIVSSRRSGHSVEDRELVRLGIHRRIGLRSQHYLSACKIVKNSHLLLTLPRSMARSTASFADNYIHDLPISIPPVELHLYWHRDRHAQPVNEWLRQVIKDAFVVITNS